MSKRQKIVAAGIVSFIIVGTGIYATKNILTANKPTINQTSANVTKQELAKVVKVSEGEFIRIDAVHNASGQAVIYNRPEGPVLSFENYKNSPGPDLFVYLAKADNVNALNSDIGQYISLGHLKSLSGDQTYELPGEYKDYKSVVIWCRAFGVNFSSASLHPASN